MIVPFAGRKKERKKEKQEKKQDWDENHTFSYGRVKYEVLE